MSPLLEKQLKTQIKTLLKPSLFSSGRTKDCLSTSGGMTTTPPPDNMTDNDTVTWIRSMKSLPETIDLGTDRLQMMLSVSSKPSGDGFRILYETMYPEDLG